MNNSYCIEAWGDFACFSRPESKVERFSYPAPTPSASRAIFDAIYWKKTFRWNITRIVMISPPRYIALRRNEVKEKAPSERTITQWMKGSGDFDPIIADGDRDMLGSDSKGRTQRQTMALKDVRYLIYADPRPWPGSEGEMPAIRSQFERRASQGKCVYQPYFGCREFPAFFRLVIKDETAPAPYSFSADIGWMVYDVFDLSRPGTDTSPPHISLFHAEVKNGVLEIPAYESADVKKPSRGGAS